MCPKRGRPGREPPSSRTGASSWDQAIRIANAYAPEHLEIATADPNQIAEQIRFAGTVLLGQWTTFASSNFALGTPATLSTTDHAKHSSGVIAHTYPNQVSIADIGEDEFWTGLLVAAPWLDGRSPTTSASGQPALGSSRPVPSLQVVADR